MNVHVNVFPFRILLDWHTTERRMLISSVNCQSDKYCEDNDNMTYDIYGNIFISTGDSD